ncbi:MAG: molybdopterin-dependent oxidoreductase, partial [Chloroflexi bacterium]|nr:molybdopterin-dependent oxidoreductase [Chloroflexota bacterium]
GVVRVDEQGHVWVFTGACSQGQGHETTLAQIAAEQLDVDVDQVTVVPGDTAGIARGWGTLASRSAVVAGTAIAQASRDMAEQLKQLAAEVLEAAPADLELHRGTVRVVGTPTRSVTFAQLAAHARAARGGAPPSVPIGGREQAPEPPVPHQGVERPTHPGASEPQGPQRSTVASPGELAGDPSLVADGGAHAPEHLTTSLEATRYFEPPTVTYANAVHAALVEVDIATGAVRLLKYVVVHDCGRVINPLVVDGQIHGGVAQGIGNALYEELHYDANGQLVTASLMDYLLPTIGEMPPFALGHRESPSPRNPLGIKGLGEGGCISPPAAVSNAVEDALRPLGVEVRELPLTPERVLALIEAAQTQGDQG